jgi:hypothetical protein
MSKSLCQNVKNTSQTHNLLGGKILVVYKRPEGKGRYKHSPTLAKELIDTTFISIINTKTLNYPICLRDIPKQLPSLPHMIII